MPVIESRGQSFDSAWAKQLETQETKERPRLKSIFNCPKCGVPHVSGNAGAYGGKWETLNIFFRVVITKGGSYREYRCLRCGHSWEDKSE